MRIYLLILLAFLVLGCQKADTGTDSVQSTARAFVVSGQAEEQKETVKKFSVLATKSGFVPDTLHAARGEQIRLTVVSLDEDTPETETRDGIDNYADSTRSGIDRADAVRFSVETYAEGVIYPGTVLVLEFAAEKAGYFAFGDDAHNDYKGTLIVS